VIGNNYKKVLIKNNHIRVVERARDVLHYSVSFGVSATGRVLSGFQVDT
jgi:hypothetical protein